MNEKLYELLLNINDELQIIKSRLSLIENQMEPPQVPTSSVCSDCNCGKAEGCARG